MRRARTRREESPLDGSHEIGGAQTVPIAPPGARPVARRPGAGGYAPEHPVVRGRATAPPEGDIGRHPTADPPFGDATALARTRANFEEVAMRFAKVLDGYKPRVVSDRSTRIAPGPDRAPKLPPSRIDALQASLLRMEERIAILETTVLEQQRTMARVFAALWEAGQN